MLNLFKCLLGSLSWATELNVDYFLPEFIRIAAIHFIVVQFWVGGVPEVAKLLSQMNPLRIRLRRLCHLPTPVNTMPTRIGRIIHQKILLEKELSQVVVESIDNNEFFS